MKENLAVYTFGGLRLMMAGEDFTSVRSRKLEALFIYLAVTQEIQPREVLADLLWDERSQKQALANLRTLLTWLRRYFNSYVTITRTAVGLVAGSDLWLDTAELHSTITSVVGPGKPITQETAPKIEEALQLYRGDFLASFFIPEASRFEHWLIEQQATWRSLVLVTLRLLGDFHQGSGMFLKGISLAKRSLQIDPFDEAAYRRLMSLYAANDQRSEALVAFEDCKRILQDELEVEPSQETLDLYMGLKDGTIVSRNHTFIRSGRPRNNLPRQFTELVGRKDDIIQVAALLDKFPIVTVTGPGGIGKTRLAVEAARSRLSEFQDGVWIVDLAPLDDPEQVIPTTARTLGMYVDSGPQTEEAIIDYCRQQRLLLVLDNCEHLALACAHLARIVLAACSQLKILATSREILGVTGESIYPLQPLMIPDLTQVPDIDALSLCDSIQLFTARASAVRPDFNIHINNALDIAQVCVQLDGIPLALELAAAWVRLLPVAQISQRLVQDLDFLRGSDRTTLPKHQTMRACLDWSYKLLSPSGQSLLEMLSVFAGSWTLEAAEAVCATHIDPKTPVLALMDQLVAKSFLLVIHDPEYETRYRLLEPVRQYVLEKLHNSGKTELVKDLHLAYYQGLAEQAKLHLRAHRQLEWLRRLERELPNLRQALDWACREDGPMERLESGLRLMASLHFFWQSRNRQLEASRWLTSLLGLEAARRGKRKLAESMCMARADALLSMLNMIRVFWVYVEGIGGNGNRYLDECLDLYLQMGERGKRGFLEAKFNEVNFHFISPEQFIESTMEIYAEAKAIGDTYLMADCLMQAGEQLSRSWKFDLAEMNFRESLDMILTLGDRGQVPGLHACLAIVKYEQGDLEKARNHIFKARQMLSEVEDDILQSARFVFHELGRLTWRMGDYPQAEQDFRARNEAVGRNGPTPVSYQFELLSLALSQGDYQKARTELKQILDPGHHKNHTDAFWIDIYRSAMAWETGMYSQAIRYSSNILQAPHAPHMLKILARVELSFSTYAIHDWISMAEYLSSGLRLQLQSPGNLRCQTDTFMIVRQVALLANSQDRFETAARLLAAGDQSFRLNNMSFSFRTRRILQKAYRDIRKILDARTLTCVWEEGVVMNLDQALDYASRWSRSSRSRCREFLTILCENFLLVKQYHRAYFVRSAAAARKSRAASLTPYTFLAQLGVPRLAR